MQSLRIAFMNSRALIDKGGAQFAREQDFMKMIDLDSERMALDFLTESLERCQALLKPA